jgi:hypothetical protein
VETHFGARAGAGLDGQYINAVGRSLRTRRAKKLPRHARDEAALIRVHCFLGRRLLSLTTRVFTSTNASTGPS